MDKFIKGKCSSVHRNDWEVKTDDGVLRAQIDKTLSGNSLPCVGDNVTIRQDEWGNCFIYEISPRKNELFRMNNGSRQQIASNIDVVFVVSSMNNEFNIGKLERFAILGDVPNSRLCFILTKKDLCVSPELFIDLTKQRFPKAEVFATNALENDGVEQVLNAWHAGETAIFIGSSGVGKSTIINALANKELMKTGEIRHTDDKGKHTTTSRNLFYIEGGRIVIDTPGVRAVGVSTIENRDSIEEVFSQIVELESQCRFSDCNHSVGMKGCAVRQAVEDGIIDEDVLQRYFKFKRKEQSRKEIMQENTGVPEWQKKLLTKERKKKHFEREL